MSAALHITLAAVALAGWLALVLACLVYGGEAGIGLALILGGASGYGLACAEEWALRRLPEAGS